MLREFSDRNSESLDNIRAIFAEIHIFKGIVCFFIGAPCMQPMRVLFLFWSVDHTDLLHWTRTAEAFEAVDWLHQQTWLHCGIA